MPFSVYKMKAWIFPNFSIKLILYYYGSRFKTRTAKQNFGFFFLDKVTVAVYAAFLMKYVKQGNTDSSYEYRRTVH